MIGESKGVAIFEIQQRIRFRHCDPAGIVFYPRYFEMLNLLVERWFEEALDTPFGQLHLEQNRGVPTVRVEVDFKAASRVGETLRLTLQVLEIRSSAVILDLRMIGPDGKLRLSDRQTLVWVSIQPFRALEMPETLRAKMRPYLVAAAAEGSVS